MASIKREEQLTNLYEEHNRISLEDAYTKPHSFLQREEDIRYPISEERKRKFKEEIEKAFKQPTEDSKAINKGRDL